MALFFLFPPSRTCASFPRHDERAVFLTGSGVFFFSERSISPLQPPEHPLEAARSDEDAPHPLDWIFPPPRCFSPPILFTSPPCYGVIFSQIPPLFSEETSFPRLSRTKMVRFLLARNSTTTFSSRLRQAVSFLFFCVAGFSFGAIPLTVVPIFDGRRLPVPCWPPSDPPVKACQLIHTVF